MGKRIAIVTGASSGLGREFVQQLDKCLKTVEEIWVLARRVDRLIELRNSMTNIPLRILDFDIVKEVDLKSLQELLEKEQPKVCMLVNAAGAGKAGGFSEITIQEAVNMLNVNCTGLVTVTHIVLPFMEKKSHLIQIASASAFMPQKDFAVYAASKSFVLSFSRALRAELKGMVHVTIVCPGPVDTEFLLISNGEKKQKLLKRLVMVKVKPVVKKALKDARAGKELSIYGLPMKAVYVVSKILPHGMFLK